MAVCWIFARPVEYSMPHSKTHTTRLTPNSAPAQLGEEQDDRLHPSPGRTAPRPCCPSPRRSSRGTPPPGRRTSRMRVSRIVAAAKSTTKIAPHPIFRFKPFRGRFQKVHIPILKLLSGRERDSAASSIEASQPFSTVYASTCSSDQPLAKRRAAPRSSKKVEGEVFTVVKEFPCDLRAIIPLHQGQLHIERGIQVPGTFFRFPFQFLGVGSHVIQGPFPMLRAEVPGSGFQILLSA